MTKTFYSLMATVDGAELYESTLEKFAPVDIRTHCDECTTFPLPTREAALEMRARILAEYPTAEVRIYESPADYEENGNERWVSSADGLTLQIAGLALDTPKPEKTRCTAILPPKTGRGRSTRGAVLPDLPERQCSKPATHVQGTLCSRHAASVGDPEGVADQRRWKQRHIERRPPGGFARYANDPVAFAIECLGVAPWAREADFLRAIAAHDRVAMKAGQKVAKTHALAIAMLWFAKTRPGARVFFTNSSERQVLNVNYRELKKLIKGAKVELEIETVHDVPVRGVIFKNGAEITGFATDEEDRWGGLSGENMMFIVDEASGVLTSLFEGIEGNCAGDNAKIVICGNPLRPADYFFDCFGVRSAFWHTMTISSLESPNVVEGREVIRGLASLGFIRRIEQNYGKGSPFWQARIAGDFPQHSEYNVAGLGDVLAAVQRGLNAAFDLSQPLVGGLDVGRFGDDESVLALVRGLVVVALYAFRGLDGPTLAGHVAEKVSQHRHGEERVRVAVDVIGIGASPYDAMSAYPWIDAVPVNVSESPTINDHYSRLRDQLWFETAKWLKTGAIPNDQKLIAELTDPTYSFDIKGNRKVDAKDVIKRRLGRSPDRADALCLAVGTLKKRSTFDLWGDAVLDDDVLDVFYAASAPRRYL